MKELEKELLLKLEKLSKDNDTKLCLNNYLLFQNEIKKLNKFKYSNMYNIDFSSNEDYFCWDIDDDDKYHKFKINSFNNLILNLDYSRLNNNNKNVIEFKKAINNAKDEYKKHYYNNQQQKLKNGNKYEKLIIDYIKFHNEGVKNNKLELKKKIIDEMNNMENKMKIKNEEIKIKNEQLNKLENEIKIKNEQLEKINKDIAMKNKKYEVKVQNNNMEEENKVRLSIDLSNNDVIVDDKGNKKKKVMEIKMKNKRGSKPIKIYRRIINKKENKKKVETFQDLIAKKKINLVNRRQLFKDYIINKK